MTEQPVDPRLDDELRNALRRRDPGDAPSVLRTWVQGVPDEAQPKDRFRLRRPFTAALGLAAVVLLAVIGLTTIRHLAPVGEPGASVSDQPTPSQSAAASPIAAFDPTLEGPGVSGTDDFSPAILVALVCAILVVIVISVSGWRLLLSALVAALLAGWALVGSFVPVTILVSGYGLGLNTVRAPQVPGSDEELLYELAPANGSFSVGLDLFSEGPLPIRIEGIVSPLFGRDPRSFAPTMRFTAVWIDGEPNGGMTGPSRPFSPFTMPRSGQSIWLVGRAGGCVLGTAFDPSNPGTEIGFRIIDSLDLRVSVLGWPRTLHLALPFRLVEPNPGSCPGPTPEASRSPSP